MPGTTRARVRPALVTVGLVRTQGRLGVLSVGRGVSHDIHLKAAQGHTRELRAAVAWQLVWRAIGYSPLSGGDSGRLAHRLVRPGGRGALRPPVARLRGGMLLWESGAWQGRPWCAGLSAPGGDCVVAGAAAGVEPSRSAAGVTLAALRRVGAVATCASWASRRRPVPVDHGAGVVGRPCARGAVRVLAASGAARALVRAARCR